MKANELMIGDWVYRMDFNTPVPTKIIGVEVVNYDKMEYVVDILNKNGYTVLLYLNEIKPILLTPEILEKNGFVVNKHVYPYPYYKYEVKEDKLKVEFAFPQGNKTSYKEPWVYIDSERVFIEHLPCMFVHKLQHLFRLCRIDKEIEL